MAHLHDPLSLVRFTLADFPDLICSISVRRERSIKSDLTSWSCDGRLMKVDFSLPSRGRLPLAHKDQTARFVNRDGRLGGHASGDRHDQCNCGIDLLLQLGLRRIDIRGRMRRPPTQARISPSSWRCHSYSLEAFPGISGRAAEAMASPRIRTGCLHRNRYGLAKADRTSRGGL
jgi:hypothetical protein